MMHMKISTLELKLTPSVVRNTLRENLMKTIKWSVELSADFLEPFYVDVGNPGRWSNLPSRGRKIARIYIQSYNPEMPG